MSKRKYITEDQRLTADAQIKSLQRQINYDTKDYTVELVVQKFKKDEFFIPDYQRGFVWKEKNKSSFIESVLLGLPIPFMFFADCEDGKLEIIDGAQRVQTLVAFVTGKLVLSQLPKLSALHGFRFDDLSEAQKRRFWNRPLRIVVLEESTPKDVRQDIFNRINTSGIKAKESEIRRGSYPGRLTDYIDACSANERFVKLCPVTDAQEIRRERFELLLRFFAYSNCYLEFDHAVKDFLDEFKNHILPGLGDIPLSELTSKMVGEFLEERRRFGNHRSGSSGLGEETMRHIHRLLQQCLDQAIRDGLLTENPAKAFRYRKSTTVKANIMTPLEMEDYLDAAERLGYLPMFMLALTTGLRQGELIALKWSDLNIENRTLTIAENRAVVRRELVEYGSQTRTIALTPEVIDLLIREHDKYPSSPLMFMHPATLKPYSPQMVRRMHNEIIKEAGLDHIRFTDLRHTCAVLSLRNGMETKELARMLGHYRPSITRQNYEPYLPSTAKKDEDMPKEATQSELQQAANILDNLLKF